MVKSKTDNYQGLPENGRAGAVLQLITIIIKKRLIGGCLNRNNETNGIMLKEYTS